MVLDLIRPKCLSGSVGDAVPVISAVLYDKPLEKLGNYTILGNAILHSRKLFSCNIEPRIVDILAPNQSMLSTLPSSSQVC